MNDTMKAIRKRGNTYVYNKPCKKVSIPIKTDEDDEYIYYRHPTRKMKWKTKKRVVDNG